MKYDSESCRTGKLQPLEYAMFCVRIILNAEPGARQSLLRGFRLPTG
jgi:hypothetical protein